MPPQGLRFTLPAADRLRRAIQDAGGVEVFAIGDVEGGVVTELTISCRGQQDRVPALLERPRAGQVVIHNHPSGNIQPSDADLQLAAIYGDNGVGVVITDSQVTRSNWVVEPHAEKVVKVGEDAVVAFFEEELRRVMPDFEPRPGQIDMARDVMRAFDEDRPFVVEAGTGTGKSLAYLVPAALWAIANDAKVVVSTHTKALQGQLLASDLPVLAKAGLKVRYAVLQGRTNYVCKRRLGLAVEEAKHGAPEERAILDTIAAWEQTTADGCRADLPVAVEPALWERIESDSDLTLRVKCPHYATCHFYQARRRAAAAHVVVVNHALLLADLALRSEGAPAGVLPKYKRLVVDEAHHLEDSATGAVAERLSTRMIVRATWPLLGTQKRRGALDRVAEPNGPMSKLPADQRAEFEAAAVMASMNTRALADDARGALAVVATEALPDDGTPLRVTAETEETPVWKELLVPTVNILAQRLEEAAGSLDKVTSAFDEVDLPEALAQPVLDVKRAQRRITEQAAVARAFLEHREEICRWVEPERTRGQGSARTPPEAGAAPERATRRAAELSGSGRAEPRSERLRERSSWGSGGLDASLNLAPVEVSPLLKKLLWDKIPGSVATSATLTVAGRFDFWKRRSGLFDDDVLTATLPSPFDHAVQAVLALPRDLPEPDDDGFLAATARAVVDAVRISDGGAFVLCTSYRAVDAYGAALRDALPYDQPVLLQGKSGRSSLLERFRENRRSVLVGTDSFWEGVSVKGDGLRLVVIPRLPFRVPTEPLRIARHERIAARGGDPFRAFSLPEAVLKMRQGYGRLIRHKGDRGVVLVLDRRLHERFYGAVVLGSLPPARRVVGPWERVKEEMTAFYAHRAAPAVPKGDVASFLAGLRGKP
jgi:ATP-dependent DNA helicase DinG